jgi:hypothetical protein
MEFSRRSALYGARCGLYIGPRRLLLALRYLDYLLTIDDDHLTRVSVLESYGLWK